MRKKILPLLFFSFLLLISSLFFSQSLIAQTPLLTYEPVVSSGLSAPVDIVAANDGSNRMFIVQQRGTILIMEGTTLRTTPFLDISSLLGTGDEQGLLSMAFHPDYASNGLFFVYYTAPNNDIVVARYRVSADPNIAVNTADPVTPLVIIAKPASNHNGGHLEFRKDGSINYLYFATGDGGGANDPDNNAQNTSSHLGKMLRINVDATDPLPLVPEVWAIGLRNPYRWSFDKNNGDMWIGDVGQDLKEEVDFRAGGIAGANYGWRCFEGTIQNASVTPCNPSDDIAPLFEYDNPEPGPSSIVGGVVYHGTSTPALDGYYITADFFSGQVWLIRSPSFGGYLVKTETGLPTNISAFGADNDGELYALSLNGVLYRVVLNADAILPVSLSSFSGSRSGDNNQLKWTTASEENSRSFVIEYSSNHTTYQTAGEVPASQNRQGYSYSFNHTISMPGKLYYRLRIVDNDGSFSYSPIITIDQKDAGVIKVYPTIITNNTLEVNTDLSIQRVDIISSYGKMIRTQNMNGLSGYFKVQLPVLSKGVYLVKFSGKDFQKTEKIFIQ